MSVVVVYPVEVAAYQVSVQSDEAMIGLEAVENGARKRVGIITFREGAGGQFINRGGFLDIARPLALFSGVLDMLRNEKPITLNENGTLSTTSEPVGEAEE